MAIPLIGKLLPTIILVFGFIVSSCNNVSEQSKTVNLLNASIEKESILKVMKKQQDDWNSGSIDQFMEGYWENDSLSFVGSKGVAKSWVTTLNNYKSAYPTQEHMGILEFEVIELRRLADQAYYMIGKFGLMRTEDNLSGYFTLIWEKKEGRWVITSDHTSG